MVQERARQGVHMDLVARRATTSSRSSVFIRRLRLALGRAEGREVVLPTSRCAAACIASASSGRGTRQARPRSSARSAPAVDDAIEIMPPDWPRSARRNPAATFSADSTATGCGRRCALSASRTVSVSQSLGEIDMRDLTQRMHAGIGAPGALHRAPSRRRTPRSPSVSAPCTDGPLACICQPANGVPSYSISELVARHRASASAQDRAGARRRAAQEILRLHGAACRRAAIRARRTAPSPQATVS